MMLFTFAGMVAMVGMFTHYVYLLLSPRTTKVEELDFLSKRDEKGRVYYHRSELLTIIPELKDSHGNQLFFTETQAIENLLAEHTDK
jgi:hypothetical protein